MPRPRTLTDRIESIRPERARSGTTGPERASTLGDRPRGVRRLWPVLPVLAIALLLALRALLHTPPLERLTPAAAEPRDPAGTTARTGSLAITRGGPLKPGFQSDGPARLELAAPDLVPPEPHDKLRVGQALDEATRLVPALARAATLPDGRLVVPKNAQAATLVTVGPERRITALGLELRGQGLVVERVLVRAGSAAIRFAGAPDARLVWNPVGRRGDVEYVPASSLAPEPPDRATFDAPGTARLDGAIALAILAVVVLALGFLARRRLAAVSRDTWLAMAGVLAVALVARLVGLGEQGQTWDEDVNWAAGRNYVTNLLALDFSARSWSWNFEHPPVMKVLDGIGAQLADGFTPARVLSAVWSSLACALLVPIGLRLYRFRVGVVAGLAAALLPPLVAHGQIVGHESPTTLWWALGIALSLGVHDYLPADDRRALRQLRLRLVAVGVVIGIAIASRFVNGLLGPVCAVIVVVEAPARWRRATVGWGALLMPLAALLALYAVWPRLWLHPIEALSASFAKLSNTHLPEPFLGTVTATPGPHYFLVYLFATLPVVVLGLVVLWLGRASVALARDVRARRLERARPALLVLAWFAIPLAGIMLSPVRQDGVRYVMPCLLALCVMAASELDALASHLRRAVVFHAAAVALAGYLGLTLVRTAPYYLDYFGEHVGGAGGVAARRLAETAWWGEGLEAAVAYVNEHAEPGAAVHRTCIGPYGHLAWFREDLWPAMEPNAAKASWLVVYGYSPATCRLPPDARQVFEVRHDGVTLAAVFRR